MPIRAKAATPSRTTVRRVEGGIDKPRTTGGKTAVDNDEVLQSVQRGDISQAIPDPFKEQNLYDLAAAGELRLVTPPVNLSVLMRMPNDNSILRQCIEAMVINTEGHGHRLEYIGPDGQEQSDEAKKEKEDIEAYLETLHPELSLTELRKRIRWDHETFGFAFLEVLRDRSGMPVGLTHIPAHTMRVSQLDMAEATVKVEGFRFGKKIDGETKRRFRRYVQIIGVKKVWFKEFGDPRPVNPVNGKVEDGLRYEDTATEVIFLKQYQPGQVYGLPRWFNNLVAIQGSRQAELTNLDYFKENAIPAMAVLVAGGFLHKETIEHIEEHVTAARGRAASNRVLVIEVEGDPKTASKDGVIPAPQVEIKPLAGERPNEGQFLEYDKAQQAKVRSSFRLPPIFTGHADDYTRASAMTSYEVAEGQVFGPERGVLDDTINRQILKPWGVKFWAVRSNPPRISDPDEIINAVEKFDAAGAFTPNIAIGLANEQFGLDIPTIDEEWGNFPFAIVQALATRGQLKGMEKITKEIDTQIDPKTGQPLQPGAAPGQPGQKPAAPKPGEDGEDDGSVNEKVAKTIRRSMTDLRGILDTAANQARYQPRQRTRREPMAEAA